MFAVGRWVWRQETQVISLQCDYVLKSAVAGYPVTGEETEEVRPGFGAVRYKIHSQNCQLEP